MPQVVCLARKSDPAQNTEADKGLWDQIDKEICQYLGVEQDEKQWRNNWYGYIGFLLAIGRDFDAIEKQIDDWKIENDGQRVNQMEMREINAFLRENFTVEVWREHKRG